MDWRTGYLRQARSDYEMLQRLLDAGDAPLCHCLHYLQMATEKLAKGLLTVPGGGPYPKTHDAFVTFLRVAKGRSDIRIACDFKRSDQYFAYIDSLLPLAQKIEGLSPEGDEHPNPEYPWEVGGVIYSPLDYAFADFGNFNSPQTLKIRRFIEDCFSIV